jgi:hypothetical protein
MTALTVSHNFETAAYYSRWMRDVRDAIAYPAGLNETCVSNVVPIECRSRGGEQCQKGACASIQSVCRCLHVVMFYGF